MPPPQRRRRLKISLWKGNSHHHIRQYSQLDDYHDAYVLAGVVKKIFDRMPVPLIPFKMYRKLVDDMKSMQYLIIIMKWINRVKYLTSRKVLKSYPIWIKGFFPSSSGSWCSYPPSRSKIKWPPTTYQSCLLPASWDQKSTQLKLCMSILFIIHKFSAS